MQCRHCGFVQNAAFDIGLVRYDDDYEDAQGHSAVFREFADRVCRELIDDYGLIGARALEIGCGNGDFLRRFCELSNGHGVGFDPALGSLAGVEGAVDLRADPYRAGSGAFDADVVICRHTLEHVKDLSGFLRMIREELEGCDPIVYFEVPDSGRIAAEGAFWDIYYEHCSYLDKIGFESVLRGCGFEPVRSRLDYQGQYLVVHARLGDSMPIPERTVVPDFTPLVAEIDRWAAWARHHAEKSSRIAIWAASSKAVAFLASLPGLEPVVAVDINPAKVGRHLPASGLAVVAPSELPHHDIDTIVVMNPIYLEEIRAEVAALGISPELVALGD